MCSQVADWQSNVTLLKTTLQVHKLGAHSRKRPVKDVPIFVQGDNDIVSGAVRKSGAKLFTVQYVRIYMWLKAEIHVDIEFLRCLRA